MIQSPVATHPVVGRRTQVVREGPAKPRCSGSNPLGASSPRLGVCLFWTSGAVPKGLRERSAKPSPGVRVPPAPSSAKSPSMASFAPSPDAVTIAPDHVGAAPLRTQESLVAQCDARECEYNRDGSCAAGAISIAFIGGAARCATYAPRVAGAATPPEK